MLSSYTQEKILTARDKSLWELGIHGSGDQISALGDTSFWGGFQIREVERLEASWGLIKRTNYKVDGQRHLHTCVNTDTCPRATYSKSSIQTPGHTDLQAAWLLVTIWDIKCEFLGCSKFVGSRISKSRQFQKIGALYKGVIDPIHFGGYLYPVLFLVNSWLHK